MVADRAWTRLTLVGVALGRLGLRDGIGVVVDADEGGWCSAVLATQAVAAQVDLLEWTAVDGHGQRTGMLLTVRVDPFLTVVAGDDNLE
jgi:hypothetical protein